MFVQEVKGPALAIVVPLLARGLKEKQQAMKRKVATIINNRCQLVNDPSYVLPFIDRLIPGLERAEEEMTDENAKRVLKQTRELLPRASSQWSLLRSRRPSWRPSSTTCSCSTRLSSPTWSSTALRRLGFSSTLASRRPEGLRGCVLVHCALKPHQQRHSWPSLARVCTRGDRRAEDCMLHGVLS